MDFAAHEGGLLHGQGLSYAVANRGVDHMYAMFYSVEYPLLPKDNALSSEGTVGKADKLMHRENLMALNDSGVVCKFPGDYMNPGRYEVLFDADFEDLLRMGAHIVTLEHHLNNQRGFDRSNDRLPYDLPDFDEALTECYRERNWNEEGPVPKSAVPTNGPECG